MKAELDRIYEAMEGNEESMEYHRRHGIDSMSILTITDDEKAHLVASHLAERIRGKTVVEIGGGLGLLAFHMSLHAERVYVIEANPLWTSVYVAFLHSRKPKNVTFIFGAADELAGQITADISIFCTHSDAQGMRSAGLLFAPEAIDVYGEILQTMNRDSLLEMMR